MLSSRLHHTVIIGLLLAIFITHGLGLHRHGHVPQTIVDVATHSHEAEFHVESFLTQYVINDTGHDDATWTEIDLGSAAIAKKNVDSIVLALVSAVILLILKWINLTTGSVLSKHRINPTRPKKLLCYLIPPLRAPPQ